MQYGNNPGLPAKVRWLIDFWCAVCTLTVFLGGDNPGLPTVGILGGDSPGLLTEGVLGGDNPGLPTEGFFGGDNPGLPTIVRCVIDFWWQ